MKESKNLSQSEKSNTIVGVYLDTINYDNQVNECLYSISNQKYDVDLIIYDGGLSEKELVKLQEIILSPKITVLSTDGDGNPKQDIFSAPKVNVVEIIKTKSENFPTIFNDIANYANDNGYEAFSIIESEDTITNNWYEIANIYFSENPEISIFLPIIKNWKNGSLLGFMNEGSWAEQLNAEEAGIFDSALLDKVNCAIQLGALYRTKSIIEESNEIEGRFFPMKESVKISHSYEFFLRMTYFNIKILTVPRVAYDYRLDERGTFSHTSSKVPSNLLSISEENGGMTREESGYWLELPKKEYFFEEDRNKIYEPKG